MLPVVVFRFSWVLLIFHLYQSFWLWLIVKNKKEKMMEHWKYKIGEVTKNHGLEHKDRRMPADRKKNYVRYSNFHQVRRNKRISMMWTNWWCRDQNFRKYFEMRKRHNIRPSMKGFYHEQIYKDVAVKNQAIWDMRQSWKNLDTKK